MTLTSGNRHDHILRVTQLLPLIDAFPAIQGVRGRPRLSPSYDFDVYRCAPHERGTIPRIAHRGDAHDSGLGHIHWVVEQSFSWLHQFKRLQIHHEVRSDLHLGLLQLACDLICYWRLPPS